MYVEITWCLKIARNDYGKTIDQLKQFILLPEFRFGRLSIPFANSKDNKADQYVLEKEIKSNNLPSRALGVTGRKQATCM